MKEFYLSSPQDRIASIIFTAIIIPVMGLLVYALRYDLLIMIMIALGVLLVSVFLICYVINVMKGKCVVDKENNKLHIKGLRNYSIDLTNAVLLQTLPVKNGQSVSRTLFFTDAAGQIVGRIPTLFASRQGVLAEPMAIQLAKELGIAFQANVPEWEYDEEKRKEHDALVAQQQKEESKQRRKARMEYKIRKYRQK